MHHGIPCKRAVELSVWSTKDEYIYSARWRLWIFDLLTMDKSTWVGKWMRIGWHHPLQLSGKALVYLFIRPPGQVGRGHKFEASLCNNKYGCTLRATSHTRLRARDQSTSSTLIGGKGRARPSLLHTTIWRTNGVCECKMDVKFTWIYAWHPMDHVSWSRGLFSKSTSWR